MQELTWLDVLEKTLSVAVSIITIDKLMSVNSSSSARYVPYTSSTASSISST